MVRHPRMRDSALEFFARFSRLDYALREAGYWYVDENDVIVTNWDKFTSQPHIAHLYRRFRDDPQSRFLVTEPPMKRVEQDGALTWRPVRRARSTAEICGGLRRLRNNLFHGDKTHPFNQRDMRLLDAGLHIIEVLLEESEDVRWEYERDIDVA